ncbi:coiled-coil domain-containing protein 39-like isoform X1 [Anguilla anguilla]|uniref:coiled-coil domain-containing protein 39-like isoform X1 n=1 Tax=Anguilla anguilla TaxID=7936 RepID=UPI0015A960A8|nr:coiled-coil domain-containing protein 39-like isoform X1 [Anguilla anguilla]
MSSAVLYEIGWTDGFAIPVANTENKALQEEIQKKQKENSILEAKISEHKEKIQALSDHLKNVRQELSHTQVLCRAVEKETESEAHFKALAEREMGRLRQEITQLENELGALRERRNAQENNIFKATQKLEELKGQLNWDQKTLDTWLEESAQKDQDTMAILKYAQQDEARIKVLTLRVEKLTLEANQKRKVLDNERTETMTAQIALDKTAESLRQAHGERQELIRQWGNTIEQMRKRDQELQQCALLLSQMKQEVRERQDRIKEKKNFLETQEENNREYERKITGTERLAAKLRGELQELEANRTRLQDELETLRRNVDQTNIAVEARRSQLADLKREIQDKNNKVKHARLRNTALEEKLESVTQSAVSMEERAAQFEQMLMEEEQTEREIDSQLRENQKVLARGRQELQTLKSKEKTLLAEISGSRATLSNLNSRLDKLEHSSLQQQEMIYNKDFQIQLLERKLSRLRGEGNTEEEQALKKKESELAAALEEERKTAKMLALQLKKLQDEIYCAKKETEKTGAQKRELTEKIEELNLFNDISDKELNKLRFKKQDTMVENNIVKLEVKHMRDLLYNKADSVLSLEKQRLQLQAAMRERQVEINVHREMLQKQIKIADQERQKLSAEAHERLSKIDKMRKKYEILTISMAAPEGEEEKSPAYYVIKAAQEKEELQRKGDDLDAKIRRTEKEIQALENTLHVLRSTNAVYRKAFGKVTESSEEYQEKLKLEDQKRAVDELYLYKRRQIRELEENIQGMNNTLEDLLQEEAMHRRKTDEAESQILSLNKELGSQKEKLDRVTKQCSKLTREIRSAKKTKGKTWEEHDIDLRELKEFNKTVNKVLLEAMDGNPDLRSALQSYFQEASLPLPTPGSASGSRQSSKSASIRSSVRSADSSCSSSPRGSLPLPTAVSMPASRQSSKPASARSSMSSARSSGSSCGSDPGASALQSPHVTTVDLGLQLAVTSPPLAAASPRDSRRGSSAASTSSSTSSRRSQRKSP